MMSRPPAVAILHHEHAPRASQDGYLLTLLSRLWESQGIQVHHLYGTAEFVPAGIAILHVDLSVVPPAYAGLARRYPVALNSAVLDIRKRRFSTLVLNAPTAHGGPVIVKTDLNAGGGPERWVRRRTEPPLLRLTRRAWHWLARRVGKLAPADRINSSSTYELYATSAQVPAQIYQDSRLIVEKFVPERRGQWYCHRRYYFLAAAEVNQLWLSKQPICANDEDGLVKTAPIPPELQVFRRWFGIDYGKIDYVLGGGGEAIVFDVNKTPWGACPNPADLPWLHQLCDDLEQGLHGLLATAASSSD